MKRWSLPVVFGALSVLTPGALVAVPGTATAAAAVSIVHQPVLGRSVVNDNQSSTNWSGYAVSTTSASYVAGTWSEPSANCARRSSSYASFWVGLDGYSSNSVEQLGTDADCSHGTPTYYAWYEMYPAPSVTLSRAAYPVHPGDSLTASVTRSGTSYTLALSDTTATPPWHFSQTVAGSDANSSAEWIAEAPSLCNGYFCTPTSLTNFGTVSFSGAQAIDVTIAKGLIGSISSFTASGSPHHLTMVTNTGATKARPSSLDPTGTTFSDTWVHS
jgi:hypothetical protein